MNTLPTYTEQFNKITEAYIKGEIKPMDARFCFCGTLCNNLDSWNKSSLDQIHNDFMNYTGHEYVRMEQALFKGLSNNDTVAYSQEDGHEGRLFNGMVAALEVLKQIHIEHGEGIDDSPVFIKRTLQST